MATLYARKGDAQGLKAAIAANAGGTTLQFVAVGDVAAVRAKGSNPFATSTLLYTGADGQQLTTPNAIAKLLGGEQLLPASQSAAISQWTEWEATVLRPAACTQGPALQAALKHLEGALGRQTHLVGSALTLADVVVYCTLLPIKGQLSGTLAQYLNNSIGAAAHVKAAHEQVAATDEAIVAIFRDDAAAYLASKPKLPIPGQRNIMITSALPYVNNVPHLGNIIGCVLSADCYARFCRARGYNTIFVCGTDEYGTATETKAMEEGLTPQQICDKYHAIHKEIYEWFDISFDKFGRTPSRWQTHICQSIFQSLDANNCLVEQSMEQLYSEALGKFLADRFVVGTCPKCKYEDARGDQCDNCGSLLNTTELINPKCKFTNTTPVIRSTRHIFLDLPQLSPKLQQYITDTSQLGGWSTNCVQVTNAWMRDGLKNRCITRDLKWGTPVPKQGFEDKVFYVWFDAPIGYISITANYTPDWEQWWKNPEEVELVQFMGKDNVPFHTVIFPATLLGTNEKWTMMRNISVTEYLNYEGGKFSKSRGTGVFGNDAKDTKIPVEVWRYYLLSNRPEQQDTDFKWADLALRNNSELMANIGNFINRSLKFIVSFFEGVIPAIPDPLDPTIAEQLAEFGRAVGPKVEEYVAAMEKLKLREGMRIVLAISAEGNKFLQDTKPWVVVKEDKGKCAALVAGAAGMVRLLAAVLAPCMPSLSAKLLVQLNLPESAVQLDDALIKGSYQLHTLVSAGHTIGTPAPLIEPISDELIEQLRARYGGSQAERDTKAAETSTAPGAAGVAGKGAAAGAGKGAGASAGKGAAAAAGAGAKDKAAAGEKQGKSAAGTGEKKEKGGDGDKKDNGAAVAGGGGEKKEKAAGGEKKSGAAKEPEAPVDVSRVDLRVGYIRKAWRHPDAESLFVEEIDVGEAQPRQVVSGLVKYIPEAEMQGRLVVVVCNLKPANMRGVPSQAMVLAATSVDGQTVELVEPPQGSTPGERLTFEGYAGEPDEQLNPKKKIFEQVQPDFKVGDDLVARYREAVFMTKQGPCKVKSVAGSSIK